MDELELEGTVINVRVRLSGHPTQEVEITQPEENLAHALQKAGVGDHGWTVTVNGEVVTRDYKLLEDGDIIILTNKVKGA